MSHNDCYHMPELRVHPVLFAHSQAALQLGFSQLFDSRLELATFVIDSLYRLLMGKNPELVDSRIRVVIFKRQYLLITERSFWIQMFSGNTPFSPVLLEADDTVSFSNVYPDTQGSILTRQKSS